MVGTLLAEYRILELLGAGGMGEVYRAVHSRLGRVVAVKVIAPGADAANARERFFSEARIHATLRHPNIATVFEFVEAQGRCCLIMEYVDGQSLDEMLREGVPSVEQALIWFEAIAVVVAYLHEKGIVHRDIKASNIKINAEGEVKLLDFGIARTAAQREAATRLTRDGGVIGTLEYLAPELLRGEEAGPASDVWALGVLLHEITTGALPYRASGIVSMHQTIEAAAPPRPSRLKPGVPRQVDSLVAHCLQKKPDERIADAHELAREVRRARREIEDPKHHQKQNQSEVKNESATHSAPILEQPVEEKNVSPAPASRLIGARPTRRVLQARAGAIAAALLVGGVLSWRNLGAPAGENSAGNEGVANAVASSQTEPETSENAVGDAENNSGGDDIQTFKIKVAGGSAQVLRGGERIGQTPLELNEAVGTRVSLVLRSDGFRERHVEFTVSRRKSTYLFVLEKE